MPGTSNTLAITTVITFIGIIKLNDDKNILYPNNKTIPIIIFFNILKLFLSISSPLIENMFIFCIL